MNPKQIGLEGELKAIKILENLGFKNIEHPNKFYDISAEKDGKQYFIEVKTRNTINTFQITEGQLNKLRSLNGTVLILCIFKEQFNFISINEAEEKLSIVSDQDRVTISGIPISLLKEIDEEALKNNRNRSQQIVFTLEQYYHTK